MATALLTRSRLAPSERDADPVRDQYDVVVVGARCAGAATALLLARAGLSVLAVDRGAYGADTLSTHALLRPAILQLSRWNLLDAVRQAGTPKVREVVYQYDDEEVRVPIRARGDVDGLYAPRRTVLDPILVDAAICSGAHVWHRTAVRELCTDDRGRVSGVVLTDGTVDTTVRARLVVGADGVRSTVARSVHASTVFTAPVQAGTVYAFVPGLRNDAYRNVFRPGVVAGVIPTNGGLANVWASVPQARYRRERRDGLLTLLTRWLAEADPGLASLVLQHGSGFGYRAYSGFQPFARQAWGDGWALVGDAAWFSDPIGSHGISDAFVSAELLSRAVIAIANGADERAALAHYAATHRALARPLIQPVTRIASFLSDPATLQEAHMAMNQAIRTEWNTLSDLGPLPVLRTRCCG